LETLAEECNLRIEPAGNMTFQREDLAKGLEADQCYWIAHEAEARGRLVWDPRRDLPPDLVIEIEVSRSAGLDRMNLHAALGVPEVWCCDGHSLRCYLMGAGSTYQEAARSPTFPKIIMAELVPFLQPSASVDYLSSIRQFRDWVREQLAKP